MIWVWIIIVAIFVWMVYVFNTLIILRNHIKESFSEIDVQLKRRYDLIPNLVETVKGYAQHEKVVFEKVTEARAEAIKAKSVKAKEKAENELAKSVKSLFAVAENYPELKASGNFKKLQDALTETENKIEVSRRVYNKYVKEFNIKFEIFPNNLLVNMFGFNKKDYFQAKEEEKENIKVNIN